MPDPLQPYVDGWFGAERELTVIPQPKFPFEKNPIPDIYSRNYERRYQVYPNLFLPKVANRTSWTNLALYSEQVDNAVWTKTNLTVTANAGTAPDGQTTLDKLLETVTNASHQITQDVTAAALPYEASVFAVGGLGRDWIKLQYIDFAVATFSAFFNITSGYVGTVAANTTAFITPLGNGQFRCVIRFTPAAGAGFYTAALSTNGSTTSYAGDVTKGVYLWGAQMTPGTNTPYISTTSAPRAISAPDRDKVDPLAYLLDEDEPRMETSESGTVQRLFGRVPMTQTVPGSTNVSKPTLSGSFPQVFGGYRLFQPDATLSRYDAYFAQTVTSDSGVPNPYPTGGTYDLTFDGDTASGIAYNASSGTVQTALNALASVTDRGGLTVTGSYNSSGGLVIAFNSYAGGTLDLALLVSSSGTRGGAVLTNNGGYTQTVGMGAIGVGATFTGGSFTLTLFGDTTGNIAYNASVATVQAAINLLAGVIARGGCTITIPAGQTTILAPDAVTINFTVNFENAVFTAASGSLTPVGSLATPAVTDGGIGRAQKVTFSSPANTRDLYVPTGHGLTVADTLYIKGDSTYYAGIASPKFSLPDNYTVRLVIAPTDAYASATAITEVGKRTKQNYEPGSPMVSCNRVTSFYLPGVTPGITTAADIPQPQNQSDTAAFLLAVFAGTGTLNYAVGEQTPWRGPIIQQTVTTVLAADL